MTTEMEEPPLPAEQAAPIPAVVAEEEAEEPTDEPCCKGPGDINDDGTEHLPSQSFIQLSRLYAQDPQLIANKYTSFHGWVRRIRVGGGGSIVFIDMYDGTQVGSLNCLCEEVWFKGTDDNKNDKTDDDDESHYKTLTFDQLDKTEHISIGCAVVINGKIVLSPPTATQDFEIQATSVRVIGKVFDPVGYPLQKGTEKKMVSLRNLPFYRFRAQASQSVFRIRSKLDMAVHLFMDGEDVQLTDPNIMTVSDCEGAGETFMVEPLMFSNDAEGNPLRVGLTVSSQLPLEATICGFRQVYTSQKSFRAEKSDTAKHLAEFTHVEYEGAFITLDQLVAQAERFVKFVINYVMDRCEEDFKFLESRMAPSDMKPTRTLLRECMNRPFVRIKHRDAIDLIQKLVKEKVRPIKSIIILFGRYYMPIVMRTTRTFSFQPCFDSHIIL